jgi:hypothetical protein
MKVNSIKNCRNCGGVAKYIFTGNLICHQVDYFECSSCGYVQTEDPYWLDQAYAEAINESDTGIMLRNQANAKIVLITLWMLGKLHGTLVDCAGGYGILVRLLRDMGINALWSDSYCQNLLAKGFEHTNQKADLVTVFEAFEHFLSPAEELDRLLQIAPNILFSTEIIAESTPEHDSWWYYGKEHGQHIGFFRIRTLEMLAHERGKYFVSNGTSHHLILDKSINQAVWKILIRLNRFASSILRHRLVTKVWSDHRLMARVKK